MNYSKILKDNLVELIGDKGYKAWAKAEPEMFNCIISAMEQTANECKKMLHTSFEENVSFDNENEKSNFIIDIMKNVNSI